MRHCQIFISFYTVVLLQIHFGYIAARILQKVLIRLDQDPDLDLQHCLPTFLISSNKIIIRNCLWLSFCTAALLRSAPMRLSCTGLRNYSANFVKNSTWICCRTKLIAKSHYAYSKQFSQKKLQNRLLN